METTCPNCGATNRGTSHFCARCGNALPRPETKEAQGNEGALELPWLQAVQDKSVKETSNLGRRETEAAATGFAPGTSTQTPAQPEQQQAAQTTTPTPPATPTSQPEPEPIAQQEAKLPEPTEPADAPPSWVVGILEPTATSPGPAQGYEPEELAHIMPWVHGKGEGANTETEQAQPVDVHDGSAEAPQAPPSAQGLPPWLGDVTVQETLQSLPPSEQRATGAQEMEFEGIEPFAPPVDAEAAEQKPAEELPAWLRAAPVEQGQSTEAQSGDRSSQRVTALPQISPESTGSFEPAPRDVPVRSPRPGSVEALAALMQPAAPEATRRVIVGAGAGAGALPGLAAEAVAPRRGLAQWLLPDGIIYIAIVAALLAMLIIRPSLGDITAPASPGVMQFYNAIETVPAGKPVLVVYDWDASRSAEMSVLSQAVMYHIMSRNINFVTLSTIPQGPGFAQQITDAVANDPATKNKYRYGQEYLVLGYLPGNEAALRTLTSNFRTLLPLDYVNSKPLDSYTLTSHVALTKIEDFGLIIDLSSGEAELRNWIEQVASRTNVPIIAAVPQGLEPLARPYLGVPGAKLTAIVSGTSGAYQYVRQLELHGTGAGALTSRVDLNTRLNAQSVAQLLVAIVIIAAFVTLGAKGILRR